MYIESFGHAIYTSRTLLYECRCSVNECQHTSLMLLNDSRVGYFTLMLLCECRVGYFTFVALRMPCRLLHFCCFTNAVSVTSLMELHECRVGCFTVVALRMPCRLLHLCCFMNPLQDRYFNCLFKNHLNCAALFLVLLYGNEYYSILSTRKYFNRSQQTSDAEFTLR